MCSRQVTRLLLRSASATKDSAIAASCDEPLAAGRVGRTPRGGSTQRATPRGLDCGYRVPHLARELVWVHLCDSGHRASPTSPRLERGVTFGVAQRKERKLLCPKPLRALRITRRVVLGSGSRSMGKLRFAFSSVAEGRRCSACSTYVRAMR